MTKNSQYNYNVNSKKDGTFNFTITINFLKKNYFIVDLYRKNTCY